MKISANKFVSLAFDLNVGEGDDRELMDQMTVENPMNFIYGMGMMPEAFENHIKGLQPGDTFSITLTPEEGYGEAEEYQELPKDIFEVEGKFDTERIFEGAVLPMMDSQGTRYQGLVIEIKDDMVVMDFNHPLAGETLHFDGSIVDVHEPTAEEIAALTTGGCGDGCSSDGCGGGCGGCH